MLHIRQFLLSKHKQQHKKKAYKHIKTIAINKHPETLMQKFFSPSSLIAYSWSYTLPHFAQRHLQKCAVKNLRGIVLTDGVAVIHQSLSTPVLPVLSDNEFVVKVDKTVYSSCVFGLTVWSRDEKEEEGVTYRTAQIWVLGGRVLHRKEVAGTKMKPKGTDLLSPVLAVSRFLPPPPHPSVCGADLTAPRRWLGGWRHGWLSCSWRPEGWRCHSCGEIEHCHWPAATWVRSHRPRWWRCTPCRVTLGWEGGREGCWVLWHSCSLWAIHSASGKKWEDEEEY